LTFFRVGTGTDPSEDSEKLSLSSLENNFFWMSQLLVMGKPSSLANKHGSRFYAKKQLTELDNLSFFDLLFLARDAFLLAGDKPQEHMRHQSASPSPFPCC
jgi:hypothetical protein